MDPLCLFSFFFLILIFEKEFLIRLKMLDTSDSKNFEFKLSFGNRYRDESVSNDVSVIYIHVHIYIYIFDKRAIDLVHGI